MRIPVLGWQNFSQSNLGTHETASKTFSARTYVENSKGGVCVTPEISTGKGVKAWAEMVPGTQALTQLSAGL